MAAATRRLWVLRVAALATAIAGCGGGVSPAQTLPVAGEPGPTVRLGAQDVSFDSAEIGVAANHPFTIVFDNREAVPHDIAIDRQDGQGRVFEGAVFSGPATRWYAVPPLAPGNYVFLCVVHPAMSGQLVVS